MLYFYYYFTSFYFTIFLSLIYTYLLFKWINIVILNFKFSIFFKKKKTTKTTKTTTSRSCGLSLPDSLSLPVSHRTSSFRWQNRPAKLPPRSINLGLLSSGLERRRTVPGVVESAPESHAWVAISPSFWPPRGSGDLPPAGPCSVAALSGQIEDKRRSCQTSSACAVWARN